MKYLITGGAGFIGGHLASSFVKDGHEVSVIDDLSTGLLENIANLNVEFVKGDIIDSPEMERLVAECDAVIHLAAAVGVELVVHDPVRTIMTNVEGTERVLKLCAKYKRRCVAASTSEVYGKSEKMTFSETDDLIIGAPTRSRWSYACSKLLDEFMLLAYCRDKGLPGTVVRFFNTVGPRQTGRYGMVVPRFVQAALEGKDIRVFGTGEQTRCFCHVSDTVRALRMLVDDERSIGEVFNIGSSNNITINGLAERVIERTSSKSQIVRIPYSEAYENGFEDMLHRAPDCTKIHDFCSWEAQIPLDKIIDDVADSIDDVATSILT